MIEISRENLEVQENMLFSSSDQSPYNFLYDACIL